jgi:hypothetical protein
VYQFGIDVAQLRLESITVYHGDVVDGIAFSYTDGDQRRQTVRPWGGTRRSVTIVSSTTLLASFKSNTNSYTLLADI